MVQNLKAGNSAQQDFPAGSSRAAICTYRAMRCPAGSWAQLSQLSLFPGTALSSLRLFYCFKQGYSLFGVQHPLVLLRLTNPCPNCNLGCWSQMFKNYSSDRFSSLYQSWPF